MTPEERAVIEAAKRVAECFGTGGAGESLGDRLAVLSSAVEALRNPKWTASAISVWPNPYYIISQGGNPSSATTESKDLAERIAAALNRP